MYRTTITVRDGDAFAFVHAEPDVVMHGYEVEGVGFFSFFSSSDFTSTILAADFLAVDTVPIPDSLDDDDEDDADGER